MLAKIIDLFIVYGDFVMIHFQKYKCREYRHALVPVKIRMKLYKEKEIARCFFINRFVQLVASKMFLWRRDDALDFTTVLDLIAWEWVALLDQIFDQISTQNIQRLRGQIGDAIRARAC